MLDGFLNSEDFTSLRIFNPRRLEAPLPSSTSSVRSCVNASREKKNRYVVSLSSISLEAKFKLLAYAIATIYRAYLGIGNTTIRCLYIDAAIAR